MTNGNEPAHPYEGSGLPGTTGLSKREYFAAMAQVDDEMVHLTIETMVKATGFNYDASSQLSIIELHCKMEAFLKVMKADALITALNQQP